MINNTLNKMELTVIIPAFNEQNNIAKTIDSIDQEIMTYRKFRGGFLAFLPLLFTSKLGSVTLSL